MPGRRHEVFRYVVVWDTGIAPNVVGGLCTLCICKPVIRRVAEVGDWIIGLWPVRLGRYRVTYVMRVGRKLTMQEYYDCGEFDQKKPDHSKTPDNIYRFDPHVGRLRRRKDTKVHSEPAASGRDLGGLYALIADRFWYFGWVGCELPENFREKLDLTGSRRGHRVAYLHQAELDDLIARLDSKGRGAIGAPRDSRRGRQCRRPDPPPAAPIPGRQEEPARRPRTSC